MKWNQELKYNILFGVLFVFIGEGWDYFLGTVFNPEVTWGEINLGSLLFLFTFHIVYFSIYTLNYLVFAPRFLKLDKIPQYILSFFIMVLCFAGMRFFIEEILTLHLFGVHNYNLDRDNIVVIYLVDSIGYTVKPCLFSSLIFLFFRYKEKTALLHELEMQHQQAQMSVLQSQVSPHFLFNTLNGFYSDLYDQNPKIANDILKLSQLLRYITYEVKQDFMPLKREIDFIKDYLFFYKKRYENDFYVTLSTEGEIKEQKIPSLVLIHFVENVCKHGVIDNAKEPAYIKIKINKSSLEMTTENSINNSEKYMDKGVGSVNVKNRLDLVFQDNYHVAYEVEGSKFKTMLKIPL